MALFGSNPFQKSGKLQKTLIATPSKFEIRTELKKGQTRKEEGPAAPKAVGGVRGKVDKSSKMDDGVKKSVKVSAASKQIKKAKEMVRKLKTVVANKRAVESKKKTPAASGNTSKITA